MRFFRCLDCSTCKSYFRRGSGGGQEAVRGRVPPLAAMPSSGIQNATYECSSPARLSKTIFLHFGNR
eukprot:1127444-Prorocentrum_minimum.AAC.1